MEGVRGEFDDAKPKASATVFDFVVVNKDGRIVAVVESKANGSFASDAQRRFHTNGDAVTIKANGREDIVRAKIDGKRIDKTKVKTLVSRVQIDAVTKDIKKAAEIKDSKFKYKKFKKP